MKNIPLSVPNFCGNEKKYVMEAIETEWVSTGGAFIDQFEKEIANYLSIDQAVACQSGTAGIHLALRCLDVEADMEVIVPTLTFIAAVNPVKYLGAYPIFMDCDSSLTMDVEKLKKFIEFECTLVDDRLINKHTKRWIKAIIVVHVFGNNANMIEIMKLAKKYNLKVIEDATEALGSYYLEGEYKGAYLGTIGDMGVYSFNGNKIITTGGGGMLVSNNKELLDRAKYLSTQAKDDVANFIHNDIGYNYRMTNIQAALGIAQLENLEKFISIKEKNYYLYKKNLSSKVKLMQFNSNIRSNYWFYSVFVAREDKQEIIKKLHESGIITRPIWGLIHMQKPYICEQNYCIEKAIFYHEHIINIPCSSNLTNDDVVYVGDKINSIVDK